MISFKQRGRAGLQFLGSLQQFSSSALRDQAEADYAAQPEAPALAEEWKSGDVRPHVWRERLDRARDVVERSKAYRYNRFYQRFVAEQNYVRAIPATEARRKEWEAFVATKQPGDSSRLKLDPNVPIPRWYEHVEWHLEPGGWDGYDLTQPMFMSGIGPYVFSLGGYAAVDVNCDIRAQRKNVLMQFRRRDFKRIYEAGCGGATTLAVARQLFPQAELVGGDLSPSLLKNGHFVSEMLNLGITFRQEDAVKVGEADNSVDAVISKPGYGTFVEAACSGVPILYLERPDWPETPWFATWLAVHARAVVLTRERLERGNLVDALHRLWQAPPPAVPAANGATEAAQLLVRELGLA